MNPRRRPCVVEQRHSLRLDSAAVVSGHDARQHGRQSRCLSDRPTAANPTRFDMEWVTASMSESSACISLRATSSNRRKSPEATSPANRARRKRPFVSTPGSIPDVQEPGEPGVEHGDADPRGPDDPRSARALCLLDEGVIFRADEDPVSHGNRVRPCYTGGGPVVDVLHVVPVQRLEEGTDVPDGQVGVRSPRRWRRCPARSPP